jgi:hypothetical protein
MTAGELAVEYARPRNRNEVTIEVTQPALQRQRRVGTKGRSRF